MCLGVERQHSCVNTYKVVLRGTATLASIRCLFSDVHSCCISQKESASVDRVLTLFARRDTHHICFFPKSVSLATIKKLNLSC